MNLLHYEDFREYMYISIMKSSLKYTTFVSKKKKN